MKTFLYSLLCVTVWYFSFTVTGYAQPSADSLLQRSFNGKGLFEKDEILEITLRGNIRELMNDRGDDSKYHPMDIVYGAEDSNTIAITAQIKTRGHFRKQVGNCFYPPLLINFTKDELLKSSIFSEQNKMKLVMPCKDDAFVIREWLIYKLYNLVTPKSFRARLVSVKLEDTKNKKAAEPLYGILLEEEKQMAKRNGVISVNKMMLQPEHTEREAFLNMAVFEYLIGNTDWCVQYLQNIKLIAADSNAIPTTVPYDFDHSGLVGAPYARPAEELEMSSVRERRYRGFCIEDMQQFNKVIALYNNLKKEIYSLYTDCSLLDAKYKKATLKYLDEFYVTINNPNELKKAFGYPCDKSGTGNILIKGLRED
jgi:hypothetical protein